MKELTHCVFRTTNVKRISRRKKYKIFFFFRIMYLLLRNLAYCTAFLSLSALCLAVPVTRFDRENNTDFRIRALSDLTHEQQEKIKVSEDMIKSFKEKASAKAAKLFRTSARELLLKTPADNPLDNAPSLFSTKVESNSNQNAAQTMTELAKSPVNNDVDVISAITIDKVNALFKRKAERIHSSSASATANEQLFLEYKGRYEPDWLPPGTYYDFDLKFSSPIFTFEITSMNMLRMTMTFLAGSKADYYMPWNEQTMKYPMEGFAATADVSLEYVQGEVDGSYVTLNIAATEFHVAVSGMDPYIGVQLGNLLSDYFKEHFHSEAYVLGYVFTNPDNQLNDELTPKVFKMRMVADRYNTDDGSGFLLIYVMTTQDTLKDSSLHFPSHFNPLPDGHDTGLFLNNRLLYKHVIPGAMGDILTGVSHVENNGVYSWANGGEYKNPLGSYLKMTSCDTKGNWFTGYSCQWWYGYHQPNSDIRPNGLQVMRTLSSKEIGFQTFQEYRTRSCRSSSNFFKTCETFSNVAKQKVTHIFTMSVVNGGDGIHFNPHLKFDVEHPFDHTITFNTVGGQKIDETTYFALMASQATSSIEKYPPRINNLNLFLLNRILFPDHQAYNYQDVNLAHDLVLWGTTQ